MIINPYSYQTNEVLIGIDPAQTPATLTLSESNLRYTKTSGTEGLWHCANAKPVKSTGKLVFECSIESTGYICVGIVPSGSGSITALSSPTGDNPTASTCAVFTSGLRLYHGGSSYVSTGAAIDTIGTVLRMYADLDTGKIWVAKNGVLVSGNPELGTTPSYTILNLGEFEPRVGCYQNGASGRIALTSAQMSSDPIPSGWEAWA